MPKVRIKNPERILVWPNLENAVNLIEQQNYSKRKAAKIVGTPFSSQQQKC